MDSRRSWARPSQSSRALSVSTTESPSLLARTPERTLLGTGSSMRRTRCGIDGTGTCADESRRASSRAVPYPALEPSNDARCTLPWSHRLRRRVAHALDLGTECGSRMERGRRRGHHRAHRRGHDSQRGTGVGARARTSRSSGPPSTTSGSPRSTSVTRSRVARPGRPSPPASPTPARTPGSPASADHDRAGARREPATRPPMPGRTRAMRCSRSATSRRRPWP